MPLCFAGRHTAADTASSLAYPKQQGNREQYLSGLPPDTLWSFKNEYWQSPPSRLSYA